MKLWSLKDVRILTVDDFPAMRSMVISMLKAYDANNIAQARNGDEALASIAEFKPQIILCDYNLGAGKDGQQILEEAKEREILPYSSIFILTTAENTSEMVMGAVEYQPDDYLIKPFTKMVLQSRIRKVQDKKLGVEAVSKAVASKDYASSLTLLEQCIEKDSKNRFELLRLKGDVLLKNMDYEGAVTHYDSVLDMREVAWAKLGLGKAYYFQKELSDAVEIFEELADENSQFVVALDWQAKVEKELGNNSRAQELLTQAVGISPKGIRRQQSLAKIALDNKDYDNAEKAYKNVVRKGKNSIYRNPDDFGGLAKVYVNKNNNAGVAQVINSMKDEYKNADSDEKLQTAVIEGVMCNAIGADEQSKAAIEMAMTLYKETPGSLSSEYAMEMADICFAHGDKDSGSELLKHVVRNHHEDAEILEQAKQIFTDNDMADEGESLVNTTQKEVVDVNNNGVELVKKGKLRESIRLFQRAARSMPENLVVNLNAAQSLIMAMQTKGVSDKMANQTRLYLDRARIIDAKNDRYKKLLTRFKGLGK